MEFVLAQELKKPREDMELRDSRVGIESDMIEQGLVVVSQKVT